MNMSMSLFDKENMYNLRGICMMMIIVHHIIWMQMVNNGFDPVPQLTYIYLNPWGYLGTGVFFLLSGYGMFFSLQRNMPLTMKYLWDKIWKLLRNCFDFFE